MKLASIDFEYNHSKEKKLNLVCCVVRFKLNVFRYWLNENDKHEISALKACLDKLSEEGYVFLAYAVTAEARSFLALNLNPLTFKWIDLYLEYRCLTNHNHNLMYGKQLKDGRVKYTKAPIPKWKRSEEDEKSADNDKPDHNLAAACFKLLNVKIDTSHKKEMRDLIISAPEEFTDGEKKSILDYCSDDTRHLEPMFNAMLGEYKRLLRRWYNEEELLEEMFVRSEYACRTAIMEELGYPINVAKTKSFSDNVPKILFSCQKEIRDMFPDNPPFYKFKKKEGLYTMDQKAIREEIKGWLKDHPRVRWMLTDGGSSGNKDLSLSLKAFTRHFNYTHTYPEGNYFAQIVRYLKLKQNLNGFSPGGKTNFWDYVGSDGNVRPYMGIYTAQSSRSQPKASGFIPLKSAWMRCLIEPKSGYAMASIDYKSQEFLIAALLSGDTQMLKDYLSGDVYLAFGKSIGFIPKNGTKAEFKKERDMCKPIVLGIQFDMTEIGLAKDLTEKWGRKVTEEEAKKYLDAHKKAYPTLWRWKKSVQEKYKSQGFIKLPDGWYMWGDNDNFRSVGNVPVQGMGACIMRKAVALAQDAGLDVTYTLHDAIYILAKTGDITKHLQLLAKYMDEAFRFYFPGKSKALASVGLEADIWSQDFPEEVKYKDLTYQDYYGAARLMETKRQRIYKDDRGAAEYEKFKQYLELEDKTNYQTMEF